jgi:hypothetical protein
MATKIEDIKFPVYRKYKNNKNYFKIMSPALFEEIRLIGSKKTIMRTEAKLLPEKIFVQDLLFNYQSMADEIGEEEYNSVLKSDL